MWILAFSIILFIVVIGFLAYPNLPPFSTGRRCGCGQAPSNDECPRCPCNRCGQAKPRCRCNAAPNAASNCAFC